MLPGHGYRSSASAVPGESVFLPTPRSRHVRARKILRQRHEILAPIPQRGEVDRDPAHPVVEVLAEPPQRSLPLQVAVRSADQAHVGGQGLHAPHPLELPVLEDPEQLPLGGERHLAHLVQKEGPPVGEFEPAGLRLDRPGERPLLVAEHLGLPQRGGNRGPVDLEERPVASTADPVDRPRHQLLPRARLPRDQDGEGRRRGLFDHLAHVEPGGGAADHPEPLPRRGARPLPVDGLGRGHRVADDAEQLRLVERLGDVVEGAGPHRLDRVLDLPEGGDEDHRQLRVPLAATSEEGEPVHLRHPDIGDQGVGPLRVEPLRRRRAVGRRRHLVPLPRQRRLQDATEIPVVFRQKNRSLHQFKPPEASR